MPELPEVEVVRAGLVPVVQGRTIVGVQVLHPRSVRRHAGGPDDFVATLPGRTFGEPRRRGKFLWLPFTDGDALVAHLGMSGQFRVDAADAPLLLHTRVRLDFTDGEPQLRFIDQRMFGGLWLSPGGAEVPSDLAHVAPDLLEPDLDLVGLADSVRRHRSGIKRVLLDQKVVSGIGNIYADEALWRARVHFDTPADGMSRARVLRVLAAAREVMAEALAQGGTSFDALYVNVNGSSGYFSRALSVYGREGLPCPRCGTPIRRVAFANRSSHFCPRCQRRRA
ncbi:MAG: bifunctional DNA-formamidopyrimidine glycosylase/DNA-(apurinic or apyrimidinic site) lyase [Propionicimonas sp.]|uniref:bifunctional DNA-formamidopyrimidine glycosylase/DNA-(apurinic or apyrimidinic site) lyase n=1 Tax=Propionicimonas sp. TaxID=1955623 RepID=UPI002B206D17|nr:bifunctional DNA-formamidopyrimidine glycosylase/DNA-(apurinic or apyrimidinic site) lyase [Propionicimonas sp.]MEA4944317.1 bifunctional DNA-formamidopyrimidine glycosylase/DNA-(apurinic or apyrimidinic site) lyase [Propionicimonas sp.]